MQIVELSLDHPYLFCPVTGMPIVDEEDAYASPALAFTFLLEIGEFNFVKPELEKIYQECEEAANQADDDEDINSYDLFLERLEHLQNHVIFSITTRGMACGPVGTTIHYCFDMNYDKDDVED